MQFYRKTRKGFQGAFIKLLIKILAGITILTIIIFVLGKLDLPAPNKLIKQKISNEKFKIIK